MRLINYIKNPDPSDTVHNKIKDQEGLRLNFSYGVKLLRHQEQRKMVGNAVITPRFPVVRIINPMHLNLTEREETNEIGKEGS